MSGNYVIPCRANSQRPNLATHQGLLISSPVCLALWHTAFVLVCDVVSDVLSGVTTLRSASHWAEKRELPLFVAISSDLVISGAESVRRFIGSNFHPAPLRVPLTHLCFTFLSRSQH